MKKITLIISLILVSLLGFSQYTNFELQIASGVSDYRNSKGLSDINFLPSLNDKLDFLLERVVEVNSLWNHDGGHSSNFKYSYKLISEQIKENSVVHKEIEKMYPHIEFKHETLKLVKSEGETIFNSISHHAGENLCRTNYDTYNSKRFVSNWINSPIHEHIMTLDKDKENVVPIGVINVIYDGEWCYATLIIILLEKE